MGAPRLKVANDLTAFVSIPAVKFDYRATLRLAIEFWAENGPVSLPDAFHVAFAKDMRLNQIYTFGKKVDRYPGIERIEP